MRKPRVMVINAYADRTPAARANRWFAPQSIITGTLAGQLDSQKVDVRVHCEFFQGPLRDLNALRWPDLLVLTGLNTAFDRMKQISAFAQALQPGVVVAAGGPAVRVLPRLAARYFHHVCTGDVEEMAPLAHSVFGRDVSADEPFPRFDLMRWPGPVGYAESSRNCNYRCGFCAMTAENRPHQVYEDDFLRRQILAQPGRACIMLLDQNFFGGPRERVRQRLDLLQELHESGHLRGWSALVTADFFAQPEWTERAARAGCIGLFSGVESFSPQQLQAYRKRQNLVLPQVEMIRACLEAGLVFHYGLMVDLMERRIDDVRAEGEFLLDHPELSLPSFLSLAIPLLGTPLFHQRLAQGALRPNLRLRDMDGRSLMTDTLDPTEAARAFARRMDRGLFPKGRLARHAAGFARRYGRTLRPWGMTSALACHWNLAFPMLGSNGRSGRWRPDRRYDGTIEADAPVDGSALSGLPTDAGHLPAPLPAHLAAHFEPLRVTDAAGGLHPALQADLGSPSPASAHRRTAGVPSGALPPNIVVSVG